MTEEIKAKLKTKLELIKAHPEYYWDWPASKNKDYIYYKKFLLWSVKP